MIVTVQEPINLELFSCAGGMAEGFRRAGIEFDFAIDFEEDHCTSYEMNLGYRPLRMDIRDFLRLVRAGFRLWVRLLVADPPCTPWSRAGKRQGTEDERDMLEETCELITILQPDCYLIGNVPGLDDSKNWHVVQRVIGGLRHHGYCVVDFAALDAADYGVPQHRIRPFWFGHKEGPCLRWPQPTHGDPNVLHTLPVPGIDPLLPWVTCAQALGHLRGKDLGRPVKLRKRNQHSDQHGSIPAKPARVVGTSNLSDGNVMLPGPGFTEQPRRKIRHPDQPAKTITRNPVGDGSVLISERHLPATMDAPAPCVTAKIRTQSSQILVTDKHPVIALNAPATTIRSGGEGHSAPMVVIAAELHHRTSEDRHPPSLMNEPAQTIRASDGGGSKRALVLDDVAVTRRRRRKDAAQSERVYPADQPAPTVTTKDDRQGNGAIVLEMPDGAKPKRPPSTKGPQSSRVHDANQPAPVVDSDGGREGRGVTLDWPWEVPSTTVTTRAGLPPPGHHPEEGSILTMAGAVILSEKAAARSSRASRNTGCSSERPSGGAGGRSVKPCRPVGLGHPVASSVKVQMDATEAAREAALPRIGPQEKAR